VKLRDHSCASLPRHSAGGGVGRWHSHDDTSGDALFVSGEINEMQRWQVVANVPHWRQLAAGMPTCRTLRWRNTSKEPVV